MKKILSLILVLAMVFSLMLMIIPHAEENAATGDLSISKANLTFADCVYLLVAVDYTAAGSADGITLKITNNNTGAVSVISPDSSIEAPAGCVAFKYMDLGAKDMGDELTLQALKDGVASGEAKTYSILEYALKAKNEGNEDLTNLVTAMINYGAKAQIAQNYTGTYDLSDTSYSYVRLIGAKFADGTSKAIMKAGDEPLSATGVGATATTCWYNTELDNLGVGTSFSVPYKAGNQTIYSSLGESFDVRNYAGSGIITEWYDGTTYHVTDASGNKVAKPTNWIYGGGTALKGSSIETNRKFYWDLDNDYLEYTYGGTEIFFTHSNFFTPDMYKQVVANGGKFTISMTLAATDVTKAMGTFLFRSFQNKTATLKTYADGVETEVTFKNSNDDTYNGIIPEFRDTNKLLLLNAATAGKLYGPYNYFGGKSSATNSTVQIPLTAANEFVTVDIVIDLFADCKMVYHNSTNKCYTCGDDGKVRLDANGQPVGDDKAGTDFRCTICYAGDKMDGTKHCQTCGLTGTVPTMFYYVNGELMNVAPAGQAYAGGVCPSVSEEYFNANLTFYNICASSQGKIQSIIVSPFDIVNDK